MKITIGTLLNSIEFDEDIKLIKSALMYADDVELIGMIEYAIYKYIPQAINNPKNLKSFLVSMDSLIRALGTSSSNEVLLQINDFHQMVSAIEEDIKRKKYKGRKEVIQTLKLEKALEKVRESVNIEVNNRLTTESANQLSNLITKNIVQVHDYNYIDFNMNDMAGGYFGNLINVMMDNSSFPLFDSSSNKIISELSKKHKLDFGNINKEVLRHAGVASSILMTLPSFESATIDEILDYKKENQTALNSFRKAIFDFSAEIESVPWEKDFEYDCIKLYHSKVVPEIENLNYISSKDTVLKNFGKKVLSDETFRRNVGWTVGGIVTTVTTTSDMADALGVFKTWIIGLSLAVVAPNIFNSFIKTIKNGVEVKEEMDEKRHILNGNSMYYYYKALKEL